MLKNARQIAMNVALVVLWAVAIFTFLYFLTGCEALQERDKREGAFRVNADCDEDTVSVEFELDQHGDESKVKTQGRP